MKSNDWCSPSFGELASCSSRKTVHANTKKENWPELDCLSQFDFAEDDSFFENDKRCAANSVNISTNKDAADCIPLPLKKSRKTISITKKGSFQDALGEVSWVDKYAPNSSAGLVVHTKKVDQVREWLLAGKNCSKARLLLLVGPTGSAKSTTLKVLAEELGLKVKEWSNRLLKTSFVREAEVSDRFLVPYVSQASQFRNYLLASCCYGSLVDAHLSNPIESLILLPEVPIQLTRDVPCLRDILAECINRAGSSLVLMSSENGPLSEHKLFPPGDLEITNGRLCQSATVISFNPVSQTSMTKALQRIASAERCQFAEATINELVMLAAGDIRAAINALQFSATEYFDMSAMKSSQSVQKKRKNKQLVVGHSSIGEKDAHLLLFRSVGRLLYCNRDAQPCGVPAEHTRHPLYRDPLVHDPSDVLDKLQISAMLFVAFLHQNICDHFTQLSDAVALLDYLSEAEILLSQWEGGASSRLAQTAGLHVASRSVAFCNSTRATQELQKRQKGTHTFRSIRKPVSTVVDASASKLRAKMKVALTSNNLSRSALLYDLPYMARNSALGSYGEDQSGATRLMLQEILQYSCKLKCESLMQTEKIMENFIEDNPTTFDKTEKISNPVIQLPKQCVDEYTIDAYDSDC